MKLKEVGFFAVVISFRCVAALLFAAISLSAADEPPSGSSIEIVPRGAWNASAPNHNAPGEHGMYDSKSNLSGWLIYDAPLDDKLKVIVIHHSALPLCDGPLVIQQKHIHERGYADIGYHFIINERGEIFEGRNINVRGAHVAGHNTGAVGIVLLGNFEESLPTETQLTSTKQLLRYLAKTYKIHYIKGHRDFISSTVCPGRQLESLLPMLATECGLTLNSDEGAVNVATESFRLQSSAR